MTKEEDCLKTSLLGHDLKGIQTKMTAGNVLYYGQRNDNKQDRKMVLEKVEQLTEWTKDIPKEHKDSCLQHL
jgi:hypothetical protein